MRPTSDVICVIPARYESSRFPGKPLAMIAGVSLLERTWRRTCEALDQNIVYVATDDDRIADHVTGFGGQVEMTSPDHPTGTDRCHEVAARLGADLVINVQGDEPLVEPDAIHAVLAAARKTPGAVVNAMSTIESESDYRSPSVPKVVATPDGRLLYMSRSAIPTTKKLEFHSAWRQVCVYAFPSTALEAFANAPKRTPLEQIEDIEILRMLELDIDVRIVEVSCGSVAVDQPEDIARVEMILRAEGNTVEPIDASATPHAP